MIEPSKEANKHCVCKTLDSALLIKEMNKTFDYEAMINARPNLFSATSVYLSSSELSQIENLIKSIERTIHSLPFENEVLKEAPPIALKETKLKGAFMGYDFHLNEDGPKLIEINTNAGGAYLNLLLAQSQLACCDEVRSPFELGQIEDQFFAMFMQEWKLQKGNEELKSIGIVDSNPSKQFLYPEFQLFKALFLKHGIDCYILDPNELSRKNNALWFGEVKIDMIYNRLTDFYLTDEVNHLLRVAVQNDEVVLTPNPRHHALYANKKNLTLLSDAAFLATTDLALSDVTLLQNGVPKTVLMTESNREILWSERKDYFFKPTKGFGSKAAYRGDKITHKVWNEISNYDYVAQRLVVPGERIMSVGEQHIDLKMDLRAYTYNGAILLVAARLYSGQTTNFRTTGGGFAPVFLL